MNTVFKFGHLIPEKKKVEIEQVQRMAIKMIKVKRMGNFLRRDKEHMTLKEDSPSWNCKSYTNLLCKLGTNTVA